MHSPVDKNQEKNPSVANESSHQQPEGNSAFQFADNRPEASVQRKLQEMANQYTAQQQLPIQKKENQTGLPDDLKSGIENLSGYSMDDVKVHRNSHKPAQLQAHAYAQGTDIHVAPGQEKHIPHEAWHVVQQKQGRVRPTMQMKGKIQINDDTGLEQEADEMGAKAMNVGQAVTQRVAAGNNIRSKKSGAKRSSNTVVQRAALVKGSLNVVGEEHGESNSRRDIEKVFTAKETDSDNYWNEGEFKRADDERGDPGGMRFLQFWGFAEKAGLSNHFTNNNCSLNTVKAQLLQHQGKLEMTSMLSGYYIINGDILMRSYKAEARNTRPDEPYRAEILQMRDLLNQHGVPFIVAVEESRKKIRNYYKILHEQGDSESEWIDTSEESFSDEDYSDSEEPLLNDPIDDAINSEEELNAALNVILGHATGLLAALQIFNQVKVTHGFGDDQDIAEKRSVQMDQAANDNVGEPGVWKIGDLHQRHMKEYGGRRYNLVSRGDFNSMLIAFDKKLGALVIGTTGAIIGGVLGGPLGAFLGAVAGGLIGLVAGHYLSKKRNKVRDV